MSKKVKIHILNSLFLMNVELSAVYNKAKNSSLPRQGRGAKSCLSHFTSEFVNLNHLNFHV